MNGNVVSGRAGVSKNGFSLGSQISFGGRMIGNIRREIDNCSIAELNFIQRVFFDGNNGLNNCLIFDDMMKSLKSELDQAQQRIGRI